MLWGSSAVAQQTTGTYLDLENISPNDVLGLSQQAGGLFVQGGFVCAVTAANGDSCAGGTGTSNGYWNILFNEPSTSLPPTFAPQYQVNPPDLLSPALWWRGLSREPEYWFGRRRLDREFQPDGPSNVREQRQPSRFHTRNEFGGARRREWQRA